LLCKKTFYKVYNKLLSIPRCGILNFLCYKEFFMKKKVALAAVLAVLAGAAVFADVSIGGFAGFAVRVNGSNESGSDVTGAFFSPNARIQITGQNDLEETRKAEPYSYCQFITGKDHPAFGEAHHPFMTGSGGWTYFAATHWMLGVRPAFDRLLVDPCIPQAWDGFSVDRLWRGARYQITVKNPRHRCKAGEGSELKVNGKSVDKILPLTQGGSCDVEVIL
jgi:hypothetical protein